MTPPVNSLHVLIKYISIVYSKIVLEVNGLVHRLIHTYIQQRHNDRINHKNHVHTITARDDTGIHVEYIHNKCSHCSTIVSVNTQSVKEDI